MKKGVGGGGACQRQRVANLDTPVFNKTSSTVNFHISNNCCCCFR